MLEAAISSLAGALLALMWTSLLLAAGNNKRGVCWLAGAGFSLAAAVLDVVPALVWRPIFTTPAGLQIGAALVGGMSGWVSGSLGTYDWRRRGVLQFVADVTWGLTGSTLACLVQAVNLVWRSRPSTSDGRTSVVRYAQGFRPRGNFAMTVGPVMSNCDQGPGRPLFKHEAVHVFQHRVFGPTYLPTYLAWTLGVGALGGVVGLFSKSMAKRAEALGYYSNPWEVWAYAVHAKAHGGREIRLVSAPLAWSVWRVAMVASAFFSAAGVAVLYIVLAVF